MQEYEGVDVAKPTTVEACNSTGITHTKAFVAQVCLFSAAKIKYNDICDDPCFTKFSARMCKTIS